MQRNRRLERRPRRARPSALRARPKALASLLVVFGLLFGQLLQLAHLLLVPHQACEHGELTHVAAPSVTPFVTTNLPPASAHAARRSGEDPRLVEASGKAAGEHEHCEPRALCRRDEGVAPFVGEASLLDVLDLGALPPAPERRPIALLSVAPKSSPPRG